MIKTGVWCLSVATAHPDWKWPYAGGGVWHFSTREEAEITEKIHKREYYAGYVKEYDLNEDQTLEDLIETNEEALEAIVFGDSYMDMPAFDSRIWEVELPMS